MSDSVARIAGLTRDEANTLADAVRILDRVESDAATDGWRSSDSMLAMRFGKVSAAAGVAETALSHFLIAASVSTDDPEAEYALHRDEEPDETDDDDAGEPAEARSYVYRGIE